MASVLLVPGAWLGGWAWKHVTSPLRDAGHDVYPATLTGLGERAHLGSPDVDLDTHVTDVVNVIEYEDLADVVLVGHSYAGLVFTGVIDAIPERIGHLVLLDALFPMGEGATSMFDTAGPEYRAFAEKEAAEHGEGWQVRMPDEPDGWVGISPADTEWVRSKAVPHPIETFAQAIESQNPAAADLPTTYVLCTQNGLPDDLLDTIRGLVSERGWDLEELDTGHWPMLSTPATVVSIVDRVCTELDAPS